MGLTIRFTKVRLPYGWMGNMSNHGIKHTTQNQIKFNVKNSETLFQALRLPKGTSIRAKVLHETNPMSAKKLAKRFISDFYVEQLSQDDILLMKYCVLLKCKSNPSLLEELFKLPDNVWIIEDVSKRIGDFKSSSLFWGAALMGQQENAKPYWVGLNMLGEIWMDIRRKSLSLTDIPKIEKQLIEKKIL